MESAGASQQEVISYILKIFSFLSFFCYSFLFICWINLCRKYYTWQTNLTPNQANNKDENNEANNNGNDSNKKSEDIVKDFLHLFHSEAMFLILSNLTGLRWAYRCCSLMMSAPIAHWLSIRINIERYLVRSRLS